MHTNQNSKQWIVFISFLWMSCSPESQNKDDAANTLSLAFAQTLFSTNQNPTSLLISDFKPPIQTALRFGCM
ncbi:hypothetical protein A0128_05360 [Leptospira tipperaryensis]|uniref:Uncharacterized protein n=1 Tax=Leptospira tipperaryensis TaxID=2564040 RepID=A0A1D7UUV3_9LEPT|nr:hypothetical protein [Leptospira tipperaryensis]AOP33323.1 hypothetical protein A0128_05360 [Leptospira tipperaryensis]